MSLLPAPDMQGIREFHAEATPALQSWWIGRDMEGITAEEIQRSRAAYYGMVEEMDEQIGRLLKNVDPDRDVFLYTSDHGDMAGEHGMFWKSCFLDGAARVPMIWRGPGIEKGRILTGLASLLDLAPTLTEAVAAEALPGAQGDSLCAALAGAQMPGGRAVTSMLLDPRSGPSCMVRTETGCRIHHSRFPDEICGEDPGLPDEWDDAEMEEVLATNSDRSRLFRKSALAGQDPPQDSWQVDPSLFTSHLSHEH
jgi:hypothetical protein